MLALRQREWNKPNYSSILVSAWDLSNLNALYEDIVDHRSYVHNLSSCEKNLGLNGIRPHDLCDTGAVLYQLCYQGN